MIETRLSAVLPAIAGEARHTPRPSVRTALITLAVACCLPGCGGVAPVPPPGGRPAKAVVCSFTEESIQVDGRLDEAAWQTAADVGEFSLPWLGAAARPAEKATRAKLLWDREFLYVSADMDDADLYADITEQDGNTWENDVFEVFLKPSATEPAYYEFHVTPLNTQFDVFLPRRGHVSRFKKLDEFGIESAVQLRGTLDDWADRDAGWTVEMKIPWASLAATGGRPQPGDEWRFALCRYDFDVSCEDP